jgi:hypothetical protein
MAKLSRLTALPGLLAGIVLTGPSVGAGCGGGAAPPAWSRNWQQDPAIVTLTGTSEIDALGDVHGDLAATARMLAAAGLITPSTPYHWTGGTRVLVVTGDVIDKGSLALPIIDLLTTIEGEAALAGGQVVVTLGNHEAEFLADPTDSKSAVFQTELRGRGLDPKKVAAGDSPYGRWLLNRPLAALIDGWFFSHAGNNAGESATVLAQHFQKLVDTPPASGRSRFNDPFLVGPSSLLEQQLWWNASAGSTSAAVIDVNLSALPAQHTVFGHDPGKIDFPDDPQGTRRPGQLVARYGGRIFLIDVGMSYAIHDSEGAMLRITRENGADQAAILFPDATSRPLWP